MRTIPLTQGQVALVDEEDWDRISGFKWYALWQPGTLSFYAVRNVPRPSIDGTRRQTQVKMHQTILGYPDSPIDHRNGDTLDNRKCNLRLATRSQNGHNSRLRKDNKSGFKGVYFHSGKGRWEAYIGVAGKRKSLGHFTTAEEAAKAYREAADHLFGEFARY